MLIVHHLGISQSDRIVWLCEELELPYELAKYDRDPVTRLAPAAYKALHPSGTAPVITDGEVVLAESGAITRVHPRASTVTGVWSSDPTSRTTPTIFSGCTTPTAPSCRPGWSIWCC